jgi:hypothetical protein
MFAGGLLRAAAAAVRRRLGAYGNRRASRPAPLSRTIPCLLALCSMLSACVTPVVEKPTPGAVKRAGYAKLWPQSEPQYLLVVKCRPSDRPTIPAGLDSTVDQFLGTWGGGYGNVPDYFFDVSYGKAWVGMRPLTRAVGWYAAPYDYNGDVALGHDRAAHVAKCMDAIPRDQRPELEGVSAIVGIDSVIIDGGACGTGPVTLHFWDADHALGCAWFNQDALYTAFATQEIAHALGMGHSWTQVYDSAAQSNILHDDGQCGGQVGEYCDRWDEMSALNTYYFYDKNWPCTPDAKICPAQSGPGLSAPTLLNRGWIPDSRIAHWPAGQNDVGERVYTLRALSHADGRDPLVVQIDAGLLKYTVEYRAPDGWDDGFKSNTSTPGNVRSAGGVVLIHRPDVHVSGGALITNVQNNGGLLPGDLIELPTLSFAGLGVVRRTVYVRVGKFDPASNSAKIAVGLTPPNTP